MIDNETTNHQRLNEAEKYRQPYTAYNIVKSPYVWSAKCIKGPDVIYKTIQLTTLTPYFITKQLKKNKQNITDRNQRQPQTTGF